jgi:large subunit ribosomal protein L22
MRYSVSSDPDTTARAILKEADISPKHAVEICNALKGKELKEAKKLLEDVGELKRAIPARASARAVIRRRPPSRYSNCWRTVSPTPSTAD